MNFFSQIIFKKFQRIFILEKLGKFEIGLDMADGPIEIMQISTVFKTLVQDKETFSQVDVFTIVFISLVLVSKLYFIST